MRHAAPTHSCTTKTILQRPRRRRGVVIARTIFAASFLLSLIFVGSGAIAQSSPTSHTPPTAPIPTANIAGEQPHSRPTVHARLAKGPITIDGKLNEPDWASAETILLTQQSPHPNQPTPYRTEVKVLIYHDALIFGVHCFDPNPKRAQAHSLARDGNPFGDDLIAINLDTFGDKRTGYSFQINAAAGRYDGLISGPGLAYFSTDWDGIWNARTARTEDGWSAEIWIPAQTLNFAGGNQHWGLEIDRFIPRDQIDLRWASPTLDADFYDMSRAGDLEIVDSLKQGLGLEFAPYLRGTMTDTENPPERNWTGTGGGEVTWRITPQLAAIATVNTDFAETEVDSRQINITPYPLYFPEKRDFFLEGANQYSFGLGLGATFVPFFSRTVGLLDGYNIPLAGGVKINGHIGPWSVALLDAETRATYVPETVVDYLGLPSPKVNGTNLFASRIAYDVDKHLRIGSIVTNGDPEALVSNTLAGGDATWSTSNFLRKYALQFGGWGATTQGDLPNGSREAWGLRFNYPNDLINCTAGTNHYGDGFYPLLSFLPRPATHQTDAGCAYRPRPSANGPFRGIRQSETSLYYSRITDTNGNVESQLFTINPLILTTTAGDSIGATVYIDHELLATPFAIAPTLTYPAGPYDFQRYGITAASSQQRVLQFYNESFLGGYYSGHMYHQKNYVSWTPFHGKVEAKVTADNYFGHSPQGNFVEKLWQFNGALSWSPDLSLSTFVQYDNVSFDLTSNTRLRWTFRPGDDFYVIWDRTWVRNTTVPGVNLDPDAESVTAKIRWTFRP
jgi:Domain of unknown function (DUF5916)